MTFKEFKARVLQEAFPLGEPENLSLDSFVVSGLIEAQRFVNCFRYRHDDVVPACNTFWHCGSTVVTAPRGRILRVYTVETGPDGTDWCHPVVLSPVRIGELRRWQASFRSKWNAAFYNRIPVAPNSGRNLPMGFDVPTATSDAVSGRSHTGLYALDAAACRLHIVPWLQTTESLVIEWQGIKRSWSDTDLVSDDPDFVRLIRTFVEREYGRKWAAQDLPTREIAYAEARADMMRTCAEETRLHGEPGSAEEVDNSTFGAFVSPTPEPVAAESTDSKIIVVGDVGDAGTDAQAVAEAVSSESPDMVVLAGDCKYPPNGAIEGLQPYELLIADGKVRAALGDNDLNDGALGSDVSSYVANPGNGRYFVQKVGPVSLFVLDGGLKVDGTLVEPDGNYPGSRQWQEVTAAILRDTSPWKIAVVHHAPYTSGATYYPGVSGLRWVSDLPVHAVIAAHSRNYERLTIRNRLHLVAGTGGLPLHSFYGTPLPGSEERDESFGYLRLTAGCAAATIDFVGTDGSVIDSVDLDAGVAHQPPVVAPDDPRVTDQPINVTVDATQSAELAIEADGTAPLSYQWFKDGAAVADATSATLSIPTTTTLDTGTYWCVVSNSVSAVASNAVVLTVNGAAEYPGDGSHVVAYATIAALQESSETALMVEVVADANGARASFARSDTPGTDDGHMVIVTGSGTTYRRTV